MPRPLDCLFIYVKADTDIGALRQEFAKLQYIVHKVVIGQTAEHGVEFAREIGAKHTNLDENADYRI